jgi:hypothetical protein
MFLNEIWMPGEMEGELFGAKERKIGGLENKFICF